SVTRYRELPITPASEFDLALLVPEAIRAEQVEDVMRRVSGRLLERVELFDRYVGSGVEAGHRSLAWRLTFRHAERTLRDREIETRRSDTLVRHLADELAAFRRRALTAESRLKEVESHEGGAMALDLSARVNQLEEE